MPAQHKIENETFFKMQKNKKYFIISPYTLIPLHTYILELTVAPSNKLEAKAISIINITMYIYRVEIKLQVSKEI